MGFTFCFNDLGDVLVSIGMQELAVAPIPAPDAVIRVPGSKSFTNRALICAALSRGESRILGFLDSDDTQAMREGLGRLGVEIEAEGDDLIVHGTGGEFAIPLHAINCRASGTTMRFLSACGALVPGRVILDGTPRMRERSIQELADGLQNLGISARSTAGFPPLTIHGTALEGGSISVDASNSSQYLSALLMIAPFAKTDLEITAGRITSRPYVDMTIETMSAFGISVESIGDSSFRIPAGQKYRPRSYAIEPDATAATYFFAAAAITGGRVRVDGLAPSSLQSDVRFVEVLGRMGCSVERDSRWMSVRGPKYLHGVDVDLNALPDSALTLGVVACFARGQTRIRNVWNLRIKETDRMAALKTELQKLGASVEVTETDIVIDPPKEVTAARIATYEDHRMAMSFAVAGLAVEGVVIEDPDCVAKTFPDFFDRLALLNG
ncbi:MAG: 3-phosphoshikimate 1-carboxyvinyltransferase [bacterium]|nr:3-phosphoshikimate 1-carboxyvinyltransferase [bacterium]